ncbi:MAG: hypothetical protein QNJ16_07760 [Rhodobacter sp.]|nr:hypothetical protein [Rhodobacter sp.]
MRTRVVFYSRTGITRLLAEALAARTVAETAEITCDRYGPGLWGWLQAGRASWRRQRPAISYAPPGEAPDCLLVGSPVWSGVLAAPVRSYLAGLSELPPRVGLFLTAGGPPPQDQAAAEATALLGRAPDGLLVMHAEDVQAGRHMDEIEDFLRDLTMHVSRPDAPG